MDAYPSYPSTLSFKDTLSALIKAALLVIGVAALLTAILFNFKVGTPFPQSLTNPTSLATIKYTTLNYPQLGNNATPLATLDTTINQQSVSLTYLVDTGALITSIPISYASALHLDTSSLSRIILSSLTAQTVFGYVTTADLNLGGHSISLPVSLADIDQPVLGRLGLLDHYTLVFDHQHQSVTFATTE